MSQPSIEGPIKERVIIADDELDRRILVSAPLKDEYEVHVVRDGEECVALLGWMLDEKKPPAMIITDLRMPQMDGIELIRKAREIAAGVKFVLITSNLGIETDELVSEIKPDLFFKKPIDPIEFKTAVKNLLVSSSDVNYHNKRIDCGNNEQ